MSFFSNNNDNNNNNTDDDKHKKHRFWIMLGVFIWIFLGVAAYVTAFNCTSDLYGGGDARKIAMLMLAGLLGPFWFVIYYFTKRSGYCQKK
jgi:drug/metabolite transporter (DMT)-like permease